MQATANTGAQVAQLAAVFKAAGPVSTKSAEMRFSIDPPTVSVSQPANPHPSLIRSENVAIPLLIGLDQGGSVPGDATAQVQGVNRHIETGINGRIGKNLRPQADPFPVDPPPIPNDAARAVVRDDVKFDRPVLASGNGNDVLGSTLPDERPAKQKIVDPDPLTVRGRSADFAFPLPDKIPNQDRSEWAIRPEKSTEPARRDSLAPAPADPAWAASHDAARKLPISDQGHQDSDSTVGNWRDTVAPAPIAASKAKIEGNSGRPRNSGWDDRASVVAPMPDRSPSKLARRTWNAPGTIPETEQGRPQSARQASGVPVTPAATFSSNPRMVDHDREAPGNITPQGRSAPENATISRESAPVSWDAAAMPEPLKFGSKEMMKQPEGETYWRVADGRIATDGQAQKTRSVISLNVPPLRNQAAVHPWSADMPPGSGTSAAKSDPAVGTDQRPAPEAYWVTKVAGEQHTVSVPARPSFEPVARLPLHIQSVPNDEGIQFRPPRPDPALQSENVPSRAGINPPPVMQDDPRAEIWRNDQVARPRIESVPAAVWATTGAVKRDEAVGQFKTMPQSNAQPAPSEPIAAFGTVAKTATRIVPETKLPSPGLPPKGSQEVTSLPFVVAQEKPRQESATTANTATWIVTEPKMPAFDLPKKGAQEVTSPPVVETQEKPREKSATITKVPDWIGAEIARGSPDAQPPAGPHLPDVDFFPQLVSTPLRNSRDAPRAPIVSGAAFEMQAVAAGAPETRIENDLPGLDKAGRNEISELTSASSPGETTRATADPRVPRQVAEQLAAQVRALPDRPVEVTLNPEELGRVRMSINATEGAIAVSLTVERPETAELMRRNLDILGQEFRDLGYKHISFTFAGGDTGGAGGKAREPGPVSSDRDATDAQEPDAVSRPVLAGAVSGRMDLRL